MKNPVSRAVIIGAVILMASCASAPNPQQQANDPQAALAKANDLKQKVEAFGLGDYAPDEYRTALKDLKAGQEALGKDNAAAKLSLDSAIAGFTAVITKGGPLVVAKARDQSVSSRKAADDAKASVAVKDDYAKASHLFDQAGAESTAGDWESAQKDYALARDMFDSARAKALQKKATAVETLKKTERMMAESERRAAGLLSSLKAEGFDTTGGPQ